MTFLSSSLRDIYRERNGERKRASSYDTTGGNRDYVKIFPGDVKEICHIKDNGVINHIWMTMAPLDDSLEEYLHRKVVIRMYWDGEETPSVQAPIGDFYGLGHGITKNYVSAPLQMSPEDGRSMNCWFPMPFSESARIEIESNADAGIKFYFYVDYESYEEPIDSDLRFHAHWHREITEGVNFDEVTSTYYSFGGKNTTGEENYVILETEGRGHYVGCNMNIHNLNYTREWNWYGEGDDMIFIDGEPWPPRLHGTGMEDYFNTAWCPQQEQQTPYHGIILGGEPNWLGKVSYYRYHIEDPIMFEKSIKVTIEHGHDNHRSDDYSSTAYWYQTKREKALPAIPPVEDRIPLPDIKGHDPKELEEYFGY